MCNSREELNKNVIYYMMIEYSNAKCLFYPERDLLKREYMKGELEFGHDKVN